MSDLSGPKFQNITNEWSNEIIKIADETDEVNFDQGYLTDEMDDSEGDLLSFLEINDNIKFRTVIDVIEEEENVPPVSLRYFVDGKPVSSLDESPTIPDKCSVMIMSTKVAEVDCVKALYVILDGHHLSPIPRTAKHNLFLSDSVIHCIIANQLLLNVNDDGANNSCGLVLQI
eukprot:NODE_16_length_49026_cov_1.035992.p18 type:complete len:173 gc:universal NODE_16_length_49026_cov_1.035992:8292-8810(+)